MTELLTILLRIAGGGLLLLAMLHHPIGRRLRWREDCARLTPVNAAIFHVHALFICLVIALMALPCVVEPAIFVTPTRAGAWMAWSFAGFWSFRLYCQWFVYAPDLWRGKPAETMIHWVFSAVWLVLALLFAACGAVQTGWLDPTR